jgi:hypothetical protein
MVLIMMMSSNSDIQDIMLRYLNEEATVAEAEAPLMKLSTTS